MRRQKTDDTVEMLLRLHMQSALLNGDSVYDVELNLPDAVYAALIIVDVTSKLNPKEKSYWEEVTKKLKQKLKT